MGELLLEDVKIESSRKNVLQAEFSKPYFSHIKQTLLEEKKHYTIYPPASARFAAFDKTPFDEVKVVLLWQDPYHGPGQAMWLSFSVPQWITLPPSLKNIYKEIQSDMNIPQSEQPLKGDLTSWAQQWVLLLNAFLTVRAWQPASHQWVGRGEFTDSVIKTISEKRNNVVFLLRWNFAKSKKILIDTSKHLVLEAAHPSPFSAYSWFFWCKHFSKTNEYLVEHWFYPIQRI